MAGVAGGGGAFTVELDALHELTESMDRFGAQTEERVIAVHAAVEGMPLEGDVKKAAVDWADRWCSQTDDDLTTLHGIHDWAALAHRNYTEACNANVALWAT